MARGYIGGTLGEGLAGLNRLAASIAAFASGRIC